METIYTKKDFNLTTHREHEGNLYLTFFNKNTTHRLSGIVENGVIGIKTDSCNKSAEKCYYRSMLNSWIKFINRSKGNSRLHYYTTTSVIKFRTIEKANAWFDSMYDLITSLPYGQLSLFLNKKPLPENIIMFEYTTESKENGFKFFQITETFTLTPFNFPMELYNQKYMHDANDLYYYDFETMTMKQNLKSTVWQK